MLVPIAIVAAVFLALSFWLFRTLPGTSGAEGWLAGFFLLAAFSMPLWVWQTQDQPVLGDFESMLVLVSHGLMSAVMCSYTLFIGRMFRPDSSWARWVTAFLVGVEILAPLALVFFGGDRDEPHPIVLVVGTACALPFVWGFAETYHDYARMKRRVVLGLCDPVVGNRFALATIWNGALLVLPIALVPLRS